MVATENLKRQNQTSRIFFALFWDAKEYLRRPFFFALWDGSFPRGRLASESRFTRALEERCASTWSQRAHRLPSGQFAIDRVDSKRGPVALVYCRSPSDEHVRDSGM